MKLLFENNKYICQSRFEEKEIPKEAGFSWDKSGKYWWTSDPDKALILIQFADEDCKKVLEIWNEQKKVSIEASRAMDANIEIPLPQKINPRTGKPYELRPYQKAGIKYMLEFKNCLNGDDMGTGKTVMCMGCINVLKPNKILIISTKSSTYIWEEHLKSWLVEKIKIIRMTPDSPYAIMSYANAIIFNYDIIFKYIDAINSIDWDLIIIDEIHKIKSKKARRSYVIYGKRGNQKENIPEIKKLSAKRIIGLTGTLIVNKPHESFYILNYLMPDIFPNWYKFVSRYCNAHQGRFGMDITGASNLEEYQAKIRANGFIRREKKDVLTELPPKTREIITLQSNGNISLLKEEINLYDKYENIKMQLKNLDKNSLSYKQNLSQLKSEMMISFSEFSKIRHKTALAKVPAVIDYIKDMLEENDKIVVFAHHLDVIQGIQNAFKDCSVKLIGDMSVMERENSKERFYSDPDIKLFIGSIMACGEAISLQGSSLELFIEFDPRPGIMNQCEDRLHGILRGKMDENGNYIPLTIQHLILEGSIDVRIANILVEKQEIIDRATNWNESFDKSIYEEINNA